MVFIKIGICRQIGVVATLSVLIGCTTPKQATTQTVRIVWKTPTLRYADMAFVRRYDGSVEFELYGLSNPLSKLTVTPERVCRGSFACVSSKRFVSEYFQASYPPDTLYRILRAEPIMQGVSLSKTQLGFVQKVTRPGDYDIEYRVLNRRIRFRDTINHITIMIEQQGRDR